MQCCFLVFISLAALLFCSSGAAASTNSAEPHRIVPRWQWRGTRAILQTPVTVNNHDGGNTSSYNTTVAPSGAVIINVYNNNNNNNNNNAPGASNNNQNNNGASPSPTAASPSASAAGPSLVPIANNGNLPSPPISTGAQSSSSSSSNSNNNNNNDNAGNTQALPSGAPPVQQGTTVAPGSSSQCNVNGPNCCSDQGQNSRLLPVTASATLASIATGIYNSVPAGATYTPSSSVTLGYGASTGAGGRVKVQSGPRSLDAWEAAVLALNLPAQQDGVNYDFNSGSYICVPNLYSSSGAPILVQPAVYSNGFQPGGSQANAGAGQTPYGQNTNGQTGYGQNIFG